MKIDRHDRTGVKPAVKPSFTVGAARLALAAVLALLWPATILVAENTVNEGESNQQRAEGLIDQVIDRLANGAAFDCKVRQRVRTAGREVLGVGTYLQVGGGTGQFSFQIEMHDGNGKHRLQQISDGRLAWTRSEIAGEVSLTRVDVGWLDEGARTLKRDARIKPSMKVGGPSEMLDSIRRDYDLSLGTSTLAGRPLLVIIGTLNQTRRDYISHFLHNGHWPELFPTRVNIAIAQQDDPETGFGKGLPVRIEHLSDPIAPERTDGHDPTAKPKRQIISLLEFYSIRPVAPPPIQRFRFENQDTEIDFMNETSRYEERFDIRVSAKERAKYR